MFRSGREHAGVLPAFCKFGSTAEFKRNNRDFTFSVEVLFAAAVLFPFCLIINDFPVSAALSVGLCPSMLAAVYRVLSPLSA